MTWKLVALLLVTSVVAAGAGAGAAVGATQTTLSFGYVEYPPLAYTDASGKPAGSLFEIGVRTLEEAGYRWEALSAPGKRLRRYLADGTVDVWIGIRSFPEEGTVLVGETLVTSIETRIYSIGRKPVIARKEDLRGHSVILLNGYSYGGWAAYVTDPANGISSEQAPDHRSAFEMLERGRADYLLDLRAPAEQILGEKAISGLRSDRLETIECFFMVSKKTPDAARVLARIEDAYRRAR